MKSFVVIGRDSNDVYIVDKVKAVNEHSARIQFKRRHLIVGLSIEEVFQDHLVNTCPPKFGDFVEVVSAKFIYYKEIIEVKTEYIGAKGIVIGVDYSKDAPYEVEFINEYAYLNREQSFLWGPENLKVT